ncbi:hypothetical protein EXIGLDRAFT_717623, partial [Exidia glandulosa HHB12029]
MSAVLAKKRKLDNGVEPEDLPAKKAALTSLLRKSIALAAASDDMDDAALKPLLDSLCGAYGLASSLELPVKKVEPANDWNWVLGAECASSMDDGDRLILAEMVGSKARLNEAGIIVKPLNWNTPDEKTNWREWIVHLPGLPDTHWAGGVFDMRVYFSATPGKLEANAVFPQKVQFTPPIFHPNVYPSGTWDTWATVGKVRSKICFPNADGAKGRVKARGSLTWITDDEDRFYQLLEGIQLALEDHNIEDPAQSEAYTCWRNNKPAAYERVREQTRMWTPDPVTGLAGRPILKRK